MFTGWTSPLSLLKEELVQREYEGHPIPDEIREKVAILDKEGDWMNTSAIDPLFDQIGKLPRSTAFHYEQPNDLEFIKSARPDGPRKLEHLSSARILDQLHGAWTGRACGCALGKPVEGIGMRGLKGMDGRETIRTYLENRGHWPLDFYFSGADAGDELSIHCPQSQRENIKFMEPDDDIHYTLIAIHVLEKHGSEFTWKNVADAWNNCLPYNAICTAETQAILNYNNAVPRSVLMGRESVDWVTSDYTSTHRNPYREWIGAQIRADGWGYACAGNPELAAEFAWRDAHWTHRANGIYGEMMFAAIIASAFVVHDARELIVIGLSEIPRNCRLSEAVTAALDEITRCNDFHSYMDWVQLHYGDLSPVHTVNNALVVIGSMIYGQMDFHKSICTSVEGAWDTDCNGATCGSIVGAARGARGLNSTLVSPLNDTIKPKVFGFEEIKMHELAERTLQVQKLITK